MLRWGSQGTLFAVWLPAQQPSHQTLLAWNCLSKHPATHAAALNAALILLLCGCRFHGKPPSKNKQEQRQRKYLEEQAVARATSSENPSAGRQTGQAVMEVGGCCEGKRGRLSWGFGPDLQAEGVRKVQLLG
jgi:hypothetical protein